MKNPSNEHSVEKREQVFELEDIIEDELGGRNEGNSGDLTIQDEEPKNNDRLQCEVNAKNGMKEQVRSGEGSKISVLRPLSSQPGMSPTISNIKSLSSRTFSLFAMNLPMSPPISTESIMQDDSTCCNRIICCPEMIRSQEVDRKFFDKNWCLDYATIFKGLTNAMIVVIFWGWLALQVVKLISTFVDSSFYTWLGDLAWPGGKIFDLLFITLMGYLVGWSLSYIPYLHFPPIVGMLLVGIVGRNVIVDGVPLYRVDMSEDRMMLALDRNESVKNFNVSLHDLGYTTARNLRSFCLTFVLMRAGLQIDARKLARHKRAICRLGIVPGSVECIVVAIAAWNWLEVDISETIVKPLPFIYCLMTGAIVAVMSPVTAIQCALELEEQGYSKAIATIIYTATSIDSVYMVSLFAMFYSFALRLWIDDSSDHIVKKSFQSSYALVAGVLVGLIFGVILIFFPHRQSPFVFWFRVINLNLACVFCTCWGYSVSNIGAGLMGTCATCFVALTGWKIIDRGFKDAKRVRMITGVLWHVAQPFLVVGIGVEIEFANWKLERALWQICVLAIGVLSRFLSTIYVAHRSDISWHECIFLALAWTTKGHIQAAIGPVAYQSLRVLYTKKTSLTNQRFKEEIKYAQGLTMISFMTVIIMGPLGSMLMMGLGPRLLTKNLPISSK